MNFSFYIYGTPNGYDQYYADSNSEQFQNFAKENSTESQLTVLRDGQLVYYAYLQRLQEKSSNFLGFCLVFNGVYCQNPKKLFDLFDRGFSEVLMKGEILKFEKGKCLFTVNKFVDKLNEFERIKLFFKHELENNFNRDFVVLPSSFKVGNGKRMNPISVKENINEIITAISEYDVVHIVNNDRSLSELDRTHKMLTELYSEKQELNEKYRKLVAKKKQYKVVILLCLVVIISTIVFFSTLNNRDETIKDLNNQIVNKDNEIEKLNDNVSDLKTKNSNLTSKNKQIQRNLQFKTTECENLRNENSELINDVENYKSRIDKLPNGFYVRRVDNDKSFKLQLYYENGYRKELGWCYEGKYYDF